MVLSIVVAVAKNQVIGHNNQIPWQLSADLKYFKKITMGKPIIMGRKTCEAIGRALPGRRNIVITRNQSYTPEGFAVFNDLYTALADCRQDPEVMVIGGQTLYETLLPQADYLYITLINKAFPGDVFFPYFKKKQWREIKRQDIDNDKQVDFNYSFVVLARQSNKLKKGGRLK